MNKHILFWICLYLFLWVPLSFGNMWPASSSFGWGGIWISQTPSSLQENISIEKHILLFQASKKNLYQKTAPYVWYNFLEKLTWVSADIIQKDSFTFRDEFNSDVSKLSHPQMFFIKKYETYASTGSVNILAQYHLKNNSPQAITEQEVYFSLGGVEHINGSLSEIYTQTGIENVQHVYVLNNENDYPKNFRISQNHANIPFFYEFTLNALHPIYAYDDYTQPKQSKKIPVDEVKKQVKFSLSFSPFEEKVITIQYSLPYKIDIHWEKYIDYDYSPIFQWHSGEVKQSTLALIGNPWNIWYKILKDSINYKNTLPLKKIESFIYANTFSNISKQSGFKNIRIFFVNIENLNAFLKNWIWVNEPSSIFQFFFEKTQTSYDATNPPQAHISAKNTEDILIKNQGKTFKANLYQFMKHMYLR